VAQITPSYSARRHLKRLSALFYYRLHLFTCAQGPLECGVTQKSTPQTNP
jgi:hypothetical protein